MTPVDGITPPKKNYKKKPVKKNVVKTTPPQKSAKKIIDNSILHTQNKHRIVWLISIVIVFIIFITWASLFFGGELIKEESNNNGTFLEKFSNEINDIWTSFKKDYLKIKNSTEEKQTEEERIKSLEESVFPDFDQYK